MLHHNRAVSVCTDFAFFVSNCLNCTEIKHSNCISNLVYSSAWLILVSFVSISKYMSSRPSHGHQRCKNLERKIVKVATQVVKVVAQNVHFGLFSDGFIIYFHCKGYHQDWLKLPPILAVGGPFYTTEQCDNSLCMNVSSLHKPLRLSCTMDHCFLTLCTLYQ